MKIFLFKNQTINKNILSLLFNRNKTVRFNYFNQNFTLYKLNKLNFSEKTNQNINTDIDKEIYDIDIKNTTNKITLKYNKEEVNFNLNNTETNTNQNLPAESSFTNLDQFIPNRSLTKSENLALLSKFVQFKSHQEEQSRNYSMKIYFSLFILLLGLFALWVPLYKTICESQGFSVKTKHTDYKFQNKPLNVLRKFSVKFVHEVDWELPWEFKPLQEKVYVNAGETCLAFYRARNNSDEPVIGLSVYDVHPQSLSMYFNKIQCFCFENQMLAPYEEVDLPVFFYIDPAINDNPEFSDESEFILKYTFYLAKRQDLAKVMAYHLKKEKEDREKLKQTKIELNKMGRNYVIDNDDDGKFTGLPGVNPHLQ
jgi:cytochrome c oxidase assembly protein subunit 11